MTKTHFTWTATLAWCAIAAASGLIGCMAGGGVAGNFDRKFTVKGHTRVEVSGTAGDVVINGSGDGQVHIHGDVHAGGGMGFGKPNEVLNETLANPGVEQRDDVIRVGKGMANVRNLRINYTIEVPRDTEVSVSVISGAENIKGVRGPVTVQAGSGGIQVADVERDTQLTTVSGAVSASNIGGDLKATTASGDVTVTQVKGNVRANSLSGTVSVSQSADRVDADCGSGKIVITGAKYDVKAHCISGELSISGDPDAHAYWDLTTVSGAVRMQVPTSANFRFSAEATSGNIRAEIPIVIEEQGKHSLHAHVGSGGGRVEVHTTSGDIIVNGGR
jgi:DUF4097 and DUF4098 domain-containing protein YvlB